MQLLSSQFAVYNPNRSTLETIVAAIPSSSRLQLVSAHHTMPGCHSSYGLPARILDLEARMLLPEQSVEVRASATASTGAQATTEGAMQ